MIVLILVRKFMRIAFLLFFILIVMVGCGNRVKYTPDYTIIELTFDKNKSAKLSDFVASNRVILLDDADGAIIGSITKMDIVDSMIVITDLNTFSIFIYNLDGRLLNRIQSIGRGPGEYQMIHSTWVDHDRREVLINARDQQKMLVFNLEGEFLREMRTPSFVCDFATLGDFSYYYASMGGFPDDNMLPSRYHMIITSPDSLLVTMKRDFFLENFIRFPFVRFSRSRNSLLFLTPMENKIYELSGMNKTLRYRVKLNPDHLYANESYKMIKSQEDISQKIGTRTGKLDGLFFMASDNFLYFSFTKYLSQFEGVVFKSIYDMAKGEVVLSYFELENDIDGFGRISPLFFSDSLFVSSFHQFQFDEATKDAIEQKHGIDFSTSVNPILVFSKLDFK